jgi:phospholipid/cholesterol/gamma-HCH transport system substrate-binding protein
MKRAIRTHLIDFIAIVVLVVLAAGVSVYVLSHERLRFPFFQSGPYKLYAEFSSAKAVTPGQGQTVRVSGVQIGDIGQVRLSNGVAVVELDLQQKYKNLIHQDATALLRPKTGLDDMFIELNPGTASSPVAKEGYTLPVGQTNPPIDPDEILSALDGDTREYLQLLVNGAGQGLKGNGGSELAQVLRRFLPTHQDLARLNSVVAQRGDALRRLINSLHVLNGALAQRQGQIVSLIESSNKVFQAFANANQGVSRSVADLPGTLQQATSTLVKVQTFANLLAPTATNLLPAVQKIPAANQATIDLALPITPVLKNQIRPFVRDARPLIRDLKPVSKNLAASTPNLSKTFQVLNHLFNILGYYPSGGQHGYLWWLAWGDHNARTVFAAQDANGDFRQLFAQLSCASLAQEAQNVPGSEAVINATPILTNAGLCPQQAAANKSAFEKWSQTHPGGLTSKAIGSGGRVNPNALFYPKLPGPSPK